MGWERGVPFFYKVEKDHCEKGGGKEEHQRQQPYRGDLLQEREHNEGEDLEIDSLKIIHIHVILGKSPHIPV